MSCHVVALPFSLGDSAGRQAGTGLAMNSDMIMAMSGLMALAAAALTGAMWGTPLFRWFLR